MIYMLMIHCEEPVWTRYDEAQQAENMRAHEELARDLEKADQYRGCGGLEPTGAATTLRARGGAVTVTDGPYAESREQFGGYYVVEVDDLDQAIAIARRIPLTPNAAVEIRPIADFRR